MNADWNNPWLVQVLGGLAVIVLAAILSLAWSRFSETRSEAHQMVEGLPVVTEDASGSPPAIWVQGDIKGLKIYDNEFEGAVNAIRFDGKVEDADIQGNKIRK